MLRGHKNARNCYFQPPQKERRHKVCVPVHFASLALEFLLPDHCNSMTSFWVIPPWELQKIPYGKNCGAMTRFWILHPIPPKSGIPQKCKCFPDAQKHFRMPQTQIQNPNYTKAGFFKGVSTTPVSSGWGNGTA